MKSEKLQKAVCTVLGEKVFIEPFSLERLAEFYALYLNSRFKWEKFITLHFQSLLEAGKYLNQQVQNDCFIGFFVVEKDTNKLAGFILGDEVSQTEVSLTFAVGESYEGKGYIFEARKLMEHLLKSVGFKYAEAICDVDNIRCTTLLCRGGYCLVHTQKIDIGMLSMVLKFYRKKL